MTSVFAYVAAIGRGGHYQIGGFLLLIQFLVMCFLNKGDAEDVLSGFGLLCWRTE
jgi:hypothetical protein